MRLFKEREHVCNVLPRQRTTKTLNALADMRCVVRIWGKTGFLVVWLI